MRAPFPPNEAERLEALRAYAILDTLPEQIYDDVIYLASQICEAPIALVSLVDDSRQWFKSQVGLEVGETPRDQAFCAHAILTPTDLMVVSDTRQDARFAENPLVTAAPYIRFYAGAPLVTSRGAGLGTLCVIDRVPRQLTDRQQEALRALSRQVMAHLEQRKTLIEIAQHAVAREQYQQQLEAYQHELEEANARLEQQTMTDSLTGLMSRHAFERALETELDRVARYAIPLSLAILDVDHFKSYNDTFGHPEGDVVLLRIASVLAESSRASDVVARIGGEEFAIILPNTTASNAFVLADRFRRAVESVPWERRPMTVSVGVTTHTGNVVTRAAIMRRADKALYVSKEAGRNRVSHGDQPD